MIKMVYYVKTIIKYNEEVIFNSIGTVCAKEELAERELQKSMNHIMDVADTLGYGKCVNKYSYCDAARFKYLILTYERDNKLIYVWKIVGT